MQWVIHASVLLLTGCAGAQSALDPAGREAARILDIFWWMTSGSLIVWLAVIGLALYCTRVPPERYKGRRTTRLMIVGAGALAPIVVLGALLLYGLAPLPTFVAPAPAGTLQIAVTGEQWWWRVRYLLPNGETIALANEIRLPIGEPVEFHLDSPDVIHSFWIPSLGGKMDMIPGRINRLVLNPTRAGSFRGVCAEYCGASHALMRFSIVVQQKDEFVRWLADQAEPAQDPTDALARGGQDVFFANGCGACHAVRGTQADGVIGPDLTHVGSRLRLAADILPNDADAFQRWVAATEQLKPSVQMPPFHMLPPEQLNAMAAYLEGLK
jgi:cytochrome c oxidase subunit II